LHSVGLVFMDIVTVLGLFAAICTTISFLPQVIKTIQSKKTTDLSLGMYLLFTVGVLLWLVYGVLIHDLPVIIANAVTIILAFIILGYKLRYG